MKTISLIYLTAMLLIAQAAFAQEAMDANCTTYGAIDLGSIGNDKLNVVQNGSLGPGEFKWFKFIVTEPNSIFIKVHTDDESYYGPELGLVAYDKKMNYLAADSSLILQDLLPGLYSVRLDARPYKPVNYTLILSNNIETEPNDALTEPNDIGELSENQFFGGSIEPAGDMDFIKFNISDGKSGKLNVDCDEDVGFVLYAYNESRKHYQPTYVDSYSLSSYIEPGMYYLRMDCAGDYCESGNYALNISFEPMSCDTEPNDSFGEAISMGVLNNSSTLKENGCLKTDMDQDYYKFEVLKKMDVTIKTATYGDTRLYLYNNDEKELDYNDDSDESFGASQIERNLEPGEYYVMVNSFNSGIEYELTVEASDETLE